MSIEESAAEAGTPDVDGLSYTERYRLALDRYLEGNFVSALELVDAILGEEVEEDLKQRVARLRRRTLDRMDGAESKGDDASSGSGEALAGEELGGGESVEDESGGDESGGDELGGDELGGDELGGDELVEAGAPSVGEFEASETDPSEVDPGFGEPEGGEGEGGWSEASDVSEGAESMEDPDATVLEHPDDGEDGSELDLSGSDRSELGSSESEESDRSELEGSGSGDDEEERSSEDDDDGGSEDSGAEELGGGDEGGEDPTVTFGSVVEEAEVGAPRVEDEPARLERREGPRSGSSGRHPAVVDGPGGRPMVRPRRPQRGGVGVRPRRPGAKAPAGAAGGAGGAGGGVGGSADGSQLSGNMDKLLKVMRSVEGNMLRLAEAYQKMAKGGQRKDKAFDQLHEELRQYKSNFLISAQKPLFMDVILLFDGIGRFLRAFEEREDEQVPKDEVLHALETLRDEVLEVLYRRDIELIEEHPERLNIDFQKPVKRVETDDPQEDRKITQVIREGFRMNGAVLRPQEVVVMRRLKGEN